MEQGKVLVELRRSVCAICGVNKHNHLSSVGHNFVPGDMPILELMPWELKVGDVVAAPTNSTTIAVTVYRHH
jgi:hypothetical protein